MNRARQDSITTEIMEIVGGAEALDSDDAEVPYLDLGDAFFEQLTQADSGATI
jgi:F-type H+-transporting ATPase subunit gamma